MEITQDEFKILCEDLDVGGINRQLSTHHEIYKLIEFIVSNQNSLPVVIAQVNKYLAKPEHRNKGFQILNIVLKHLPLTLAEDKAVSWSNFAVEFNRVDANSERFLVLAKLIKICSKNANADFNRHVTTGGLFKRIMDKCLSLQTLLKSGLSIHYSLIHLVSVCLQTYPGSCGNYKLQIETFLIKYLDVPNKDGVIEEAGACLHYLQQTGQSGPNQCNYVSNWSTQLKKICATIHNFYNVLYEEEIDIHDIDKPGVDGYTFEYMNSCDSLNTTMLNGRRLKGLIKFLEEMLRNPYPVEKQIHSSYILGVVQKGLSLRMNDENKCMLDNYNKHWTLQIKLDVLQVLKHWINIMDIQSAMFQSVIFDILINCMKNIENPSTIYREYQLKLYNVFAFYINRVKPTISQKYNDQIIQHLLKFITPSITNVELNIDVSMVGKSAKGKKRSIDQRIIESGKLLKNQQEAAADKETRENICVGALKALNTLFKDVHVKITEKTCTLLFSTLLSILNDLHEGCPKIPYDSENCQVELYNFFLKLYDQPFLPRHLSLSLGLMYFTTAQIIYKENVKIYEICDKAIYILEKTCQPMCASLYEQRTSYEKENTEKNKRKRLESLQLTVADEFSSINESGNVHDNTFIEQESEENNEIQRENEEEIDYEEDKSVISGSTSSKFNINGDSFSEFASTFVNSPTYSAISSSGSKQNSSLNKKVNVLTETVITPTNRIKTLHNDSIDIKASPRDAIQLINVKDLDKSPLKFSPQEQFSPRSSVVEDFLEENPSEVNDAEVLEDRSSIYSKDTFVNDVKDVENPENLSIEAMMDAFVPETNF